MKKEEIRHNNNRSWLDKSVHAIKNIWKFANEFDLLEKIKNSKIPQAIKISGLALLLSGKNLDMKAASPENSVKDANVEKSEYVIKNSPKNNGITGIAYTSSFKAYPGKYYNEICNGSPCWLASTYETNGAGIGKKPSSIAMWNDKGNYRGLNQISTAHAQKFLKWLGTKPQFGAVYQSLKKGGIAKANWQKTAKAHEHLMTEAFEWYMVEVYNADNFKAIQEKLNAAKINVSLKKLHPAIISAMHQIMVELPSRRTTIANKIIRFTENNSGDAQKLNSEEFIKTLISNQSIQKRAIALFKDSSIHWKMAQFDSLLAKVKPENNDNQTWFQIQLTKNSSSKNSLKENNDSNTLKSKTKVLDFTPPNIQEELSLARKTLSSKTVYDYNKEKSYPIPKQTIIDDRLLKTKKISERS